MTDAPAPMTAKHDGALAALNGLVDERARTAFARCCAAQRWVEAMVCGRPYASTLDLRDRAERAFELLGPGDWRQAFAAHARIGQRRDGDAQGSAEQSGAASATAEQRAALAEGNERYEARFGHVFLIRARGRDAAEMLAALHERLQNPPEVELAIAADQQREITRRRLDDLLSRA